MNPTDLDLQRGSTYAISNSTQLLILVSGAPSLSAATFTLLDPETLEQLPGFTVSYGLPGFPQTLYVEIDAVATARYAPNQYPYVLNTSLEGESLPEYVSGLLTFT